MTTFAVTSADGTPLAVERQGGGPPLILVDGATCHRANGPLGSLATVLAERFTVFHYDRRGRGDSGDTLPYAVAREIEDLQAVVAATGGTPFVLGVSSGAVLVIRAAGAGVPLAKLALFEPPLDDAGDGDGASYETAEITGLVAEGRNGDAVETFLTGIGVPAEAVAGMRSSPVWPAMEAVAPTIVYDCTICDSTTLDHVRAVPVPALVLDSEGSTDDLTGWAADVVHALPQGSHRSLAGEWHQVPDDVLAPALAEFFLG